MLTHAQFEELCALATSGQLSAADASQLDSHLQNCDSCRRFLNDARILSDTVIPRIVRIPQKRCLLSPPGCVSGFWRELRAQGTSDESGATDGGSGVRLGNVFFAFFRWRRPDAQRSHRYVACVVQHSASLEVGSDRCERVCCVLRSRFHPASFRSRQGSRCFGGSRRSFGSHCAGRANPHLDQFQTLTADRDKLAQQSAELVSQLAAVNQAKQETEAALHEQIASLQSSAARDHDALLQQTASLNDRATALQSQLESLRQKQTVTEAALAVQEQETNKYQSRVGTLQAQLASQPQFQQPNVGEVGNLAAARNLHIIDVYDSDTEGNRQKAFGRLFYVEGRSLVFYAYDLAKAHSQKRITFHVWGSHADSKETTLSLGVLHDDDPSEQRWALTYDDP